MGVSGTSLPASTVAAGLPVARATPGCYFRVQRDGCGLVDAITNPKAACGCCDPKARKELREKPLSGWRRVSPRCHSFMSEEFSWSICCIAPIPLAFAHCWVSSCEASQAAAGYWTDLPA